MEIEARIAQANGRLKAAKTGVRIEAMGNRLYLRATFPPKPQAAQSKPQQQRLALGYHANPYGISLAEKEARKVGALLDCGQFSWQPYLSPDTTGAIATIGHWLEQLEAELKPTVSETTWRTEYKQVFARLSPDQPLTEETLRGIILATKPDSRTRKRYCDSLGKLAKFAGLECDFRLLRGKYSAKSVDPRSLPTDEAIAQAFHQIPNSTWQWVYGMLATFGLRNHEAFFLDTQALEQGGYMITVLEGKTGPRTVWACYPEWVEQFDLRTPKLPAVTGKHHEDFGHRVSQYFRRRQLPFEPYDLRHCWAVRTLRFGLHDSLAAMQMGHSKEVHSTIYHHWITAETHQRAFEAIMLRSDRPKAPLSERN